jgi:flagellar hook protein FlgE
MIWGQIRPFTGLWKGMFCLLAGLVLPVISRAAWVETGANTDLGIDGEGFFVFKDTQSGSVLFGRNGFLHLDAAGYLVSNGGQRLQGLDRSGGVATYGDLKIDADGAQNIAGNPLGVNGWTIDSTGDIIVTLTDGTTSFTRGTVLIQRFDHPEAFKKSPGSDLLEVPADAVPINTPDIPGTEGNGLVRTGGYFCADTLKIRLIPQGTLCVDARTDIATDWMIDGPGWFTVRDPVSDEVFATRCGAFRLDSVGRIVTQTGLRVQGLNISRGVETKGDLVIDADRLTATAGCLLGVNGWTVDASGDLNVTLSDGTTLITRGTVLLQNFSHPEKLKPLEGSLVSGLAAAGPLPDAGRPGADGLGKIRQWTVDTRTFDDLQLRRRNANKNFVQGTLVRRTNDFELAIAGNGFFLLRDPASGERFATRCGNFTRTGEGYLELGGLRLLDADASLRGVPADIRITTNDFVSVNLPVPPESLEKVRFDTSGNIRIEPRGIAGWTHVHRITLVEFMNKEPLEPVRTGIYSNLSGLESYLRPPPEGWPSQRGDAIYSGADVALADGAFTGCGDYSLGTLVADALELMEDPAGYPIHRTTPRATIDLEWDQRPWPPGEKVVEWTTNLVDWAVLPRWSRGSPFDPADGINRFYRIRINPWWIPDDN